MAGDFLGETYSHFQSSTQFRIELDKLIVAGNQDEIIRLLSNNNTFASENLSYIIAKVHQSNRINDRSLESVIEYLNSYFVLDPEHHLIAAVNALDYEKIKELTHFKNYITKNKLRMEEYRKYLFSLNLRTTLLDEIIINDGINYQDISGIRYLQCLIESYKQEHTIFLISSFINNASLNQLNFPDFEGSTALHKAAQLWEYYKQQVNSDGQEHAQSIIIELLHRGANPIIKDNNGDAFSDSQFFTENRSLCLKYATPNYRKVLESKISSLARNTKAPKLDTQHHNIKTIVPPKIKTKNKQSGFNTKTTLAALTLAVAGCYLCYKIYTKSNSSKFRNLR